MNLTLIETVYNLAPIVLCIVVALLVVSTLRLRQQTNNQHEKINQLNKELHALLSCSRGISQRLHSHQNQFQNISKRQDNLETIEPGHAGYKQAVALYNRGASEDEMQSTCDLSRGEINLITHLQKARTRNQSQQH